MRYVSDDYETILMEYAAGALDEAMSMVVSAHLALSPQARQMVREFEAIGGALIESCCGQMAMKATLESVLQRLDESPAQLARQRTISPEYPLPPSFCQFLSPEYDLEWRRTAEGLEVCRIETGCQNSNFYLHRLAPAATAPQQICRQHEIILLLAGAFSDETGSYHCGDMLIGSNRLTRRPVADPQTGCTYLMASCGSAPDNLISRLLRIFGR